MEMEVAVRDRQRLIRIDHRWIESRLRKAARRLTSEALSGGPSEVSVLLVNDSQMRDLNLRHRGLDKTTDVLSFPQADTCPSGRRDGCMSSPGGALAFPSLLGDIVINLHQAQREADARGITLKQEVARLLVHGLLHLLGHDHEAGGAEARRMTRMERRLLEGL